MKPLVFRLFHSSFKICLWNPEYWALESGIPLEKSGISLTIGIQNRSSTDKGWNPVPGIRNPRRGFPSLRRRRNSTPVSNVCKAAPKSLFWAPQRTPRITGSAFGISFPSDWQIYNGLF